MRSALIELLRCPVTGQPLHLEHAAEGEGDIEEGTLVSADGKHRFPIVDSIPRFVPASNYADNFGLQWNAFRATQLDSHSGVPVSRERFLAFSGWDPAALQGALVLDVGCGAGRFAEVALDCGARVVAVDYSSAVDACWKNLRHRPGLEVVQGDIYALPFAPGRFDFVYCFGVLQHTPDVRGAFRALPRQLRPGGSLAADVYPALWRNAIWPKYWLRPLTKRLPAGTLFRALETLVPMLLPLSTALGRIPVIGRQLRYAVPVMNYTGVFPLGPRQIQEWALLDTFDMLAPTHDHPQRIAEFRRWFLDAGLEDVWVGRPGFVVGRGRKPAS